ncbi:MAG: aspartate 1-decarboxylase [Acidobacteria bacterium]|nr:aspartate 1-decarboxylase [Acidobacteriota bacterium]MCG3195402.1 Aspartate 1-decarboxylase [Thermoanaerobaculia bacterium]MCK6684393.1 aspartate 1-decarboxylase [Thermoanaerobaculia bacterium]
MTITMLKAKIHRATVTGAHLDYEGSVTIDSDLLSAAGILPYERVEIYNVTRGTRLATYAIQGPAGSGAIEINGAAAHLAGTGDLVILAAYVDMTPVEAASHKPSLVFVDQRNRIKALREVETPATVTV